MSKYKYYIGIDTGVNTGFALWNSTERKFIVVMTMPIHRALEEVQTIHQNNPEPGELMVRIEDARLRKWIPRYKSSSREKGRREGAGSVKRDANIWEDFLVDYGIPFELVPPKANKTKLSDGGFKKLTGFQLRTSVHARDAAMLVYGY